MNKLYMGGEWREIVKNKIERANGQRIAWLTYYGLANKMIYNFFFYLFCHTNTRTIIHKSENKYL